MRHGNFGKKAIHIWTSKELPVDLWSLQLPRNNFQNSLCGALWWFFFFFCYISLFAINISFSWKLETSLRINWKHREQRCTRGAVPYYWASGNCHQYKKSCFTLLFLPNICFSGGLLMRDVHDRHSFSLVQDLYLSYVSKC